MGNTQVSIVWNGERSRAESLLAAISPDDPEDFDVELAGNGEIVELRISVHANGLGRSRATVDDILACLSAAESGLDSIK